MATNRSFPSRVRHVQKDEPVSAGVASRPDRTMEQRTNYLKEVIDSIEAGRALIHRDVAVAPDVLVGQPVYWNDENQRYEQALAAVENDLTTGMFSAADSADCVGLVLSKNAGNTAHIVLWGLVQFEDLSNAIKTETIKTGRYYLSQSQAGTLEFQRPPVTVPVAFVFGPLDACDENTWVFVQPMLRDFLEDHIHYQFELQPVPAGEHSVPANGQRHEILNADNTIEGWLPADDPIFNGMAPTGAKFGYNIAANTALERVFPPIPTVSHVLEMQRPSIFKNVRGLHKDVDLDFPNTVGNSVSDLTVPFPGADPTDTVFVTASSGPSGDGILQAWVSAVDVVTVRFVNPTGGAIEPALDTYHIQVVKDPGDAAVSTEFKGLERVSSDFYVIDKNGIWWMSDCYNEVPWPTDLNTSPQSSSSLSSFASSLSSSSLSSASGALEGVCPVPNPMRIILSFIKMTFLTDKTVVTSLQPDEGQPLEYVNCDGEIANTGELFSRLKLQLLVEDEYEGGQMLKGVTTDNKLQRGWATEGVIAGSNKVLLTGTRTRLLDINSPQSPSNPLVHQGIVIVDIQVDPTERELLPQVVALGDAVERTYKGITYLGFPDGRNSGIRAKFVVPPDGLPITPKLKIRAQLFGRGTATLTDLDTSYHILTRPTAGSPTAIVEGDTALVMDTNVAVNADEIHEIESEEIDIAAGDTVFVSLERALAGAPTYDFEIGLVRLGAVIVSGA